LVAAPGGGDDSEGDHQWGDEGRRRKATSDE